MKNRVLYELFLGLISLMLAIIIILDLMYIFPSIVDQSFKYINLITCSIFLCDYLVRLIMAKNSLKFILNNKVDLISVVPVMAIEYSIFNLGLFNFLDSNVELKIFKLIMLCILIIKFKNKIRGAVKINKFNYLLIITTIIIVLGAVVIALLEEMSFGDAIWWSFVTFTTVGYGDVLLTTKLGRVVAVILMIFGIGCIGVTTSTIAAYLVNRENRKHKKRDFKSEALEIIKFKIDNLDNISDEELENIYKTLVVLKDSKKSL